MKFMKQASVRKKRKLNIILDITDLPILRWKSIVKTYGHISFYKITLSTEDSRESSAV